MGLSLGKIAEPILLKTPMAYIIEFLDHHSSLNSLAVDDYGNTYVTGYYTESAIFDTIRLNSKGDRDAFIAKYNSEGRVVWAKTIGNKNQDEGQQVVVDDAGNVYVTGYFTKSILVEDTVLHSYMSIYDIYMGENNVFVIKYNSKGKLVWARTAVEGKKIQGKGIAVDKEENVYVLGEFYNSATFDTTTLNVNTYSDIFIVKYTHEGKVAWAKNIGGSKSVSPFQLKVSQKGSIYILGGFESLIIGNDSLTADYMEGYFIAKYSNSGKALWGRSIEGGDTSRLDVVSVEAIDVDAEDNLYLTGWVDGVVKLDHITLWPFANRKGVDFCAKYNEKGDIQWAKHSSEKIHDTMAMALGTGSDFYITGSSYSILPTDWNALTGEEKDDMYIGKYNPSGELLWEKEVGGNKSQSAPFIALNHTNTIYVAGDIYGEISLGDTTFTSNGFGVFVWKLP
ncbi:SBBP repeat-containing protein [Xanthocytophaga agilis]|nr:SBBP repeat-containing protein [Xanthocytophaga agilis]